MWSIVSTDVDSKLGERPFYNVLNLYRTSPENFHSTSGSLVWKKRRMIRKKSFDSVSWSGKEVLYFDSGKLVKVCKGVYLSVSLHSTLERLHVTDVKIVLLYK